MLRRSIFVVSFAFLSGCNNGDDGSSSDPIRSTTATLACPTSQEGIVGCWVTEKCNRVNEKDGKPSEYWGNTKVLFSQEGKIEFLGQQFVNSSCSGKPDRTTESKDVVASYTVGQSKKDVSGVEANQIIITSTFRNQETFDINTLYFISDNYRLCMSENFRVTHDSVIVSQSASFAIDFNSCLIRAGEI